MNKFLVKKRRRLDFVIQEDLVIRKFAILEFVSGLLGGKVSSEKGFEKV